MPAAEKRGGHDRRTGRSKVPAATLTTAGEGTGWGWRWQCPQTVIGWVGGELAEPEGVGGGCYDKIPTGRLKRGDPGGNGVRCAMMVLYKCE